MINLINLLHRKKLFSHRLESLNKRKEPRKPKRWKMECLQGLGVQDSGLEWWEFNGICLKEWDNFRDGRKSSPLQPCTKALACSHQRTENKMEEQWWTCFVQCSFIPIAVWLGFLKQFFLESANFFLWSTTATFTVYLVNKENFSFGFANTFSHVLL